VKHFPGHGDTKYDSHYNLPEITKTMAEIDACELVPFRRAVIEGADAVITAHIKMSAIADLATSKKEKDEAQQLPASKQFL
jgi:beta-N-acetylhexosaminidase